MKFATWDNGGLVTAGVVGEHRAACPAAGRHRPRPGPRRAAGRTGGGDGGAGRRRRCLLAGVRLLPPLAAPTVRDFVAFEEHVEGVVASVGDGTGVVPEWYQAPTFYFTNPYALIGAHDDVPVPPGSQLLDFELEVAVVVARDGASLSPEQAR